MLRDPEALSAALVARSLEAIERERLELSTFLLGVSLEDPSLSPAALDERKRAVKTAAGERLRAALAERGRAVRVVATRPDVTFILDAASGRLRLEIAAVHVYGRYRKLTRDLPQTRWHCPWCRGRGCGRCEGSGRRHEGSVEEILGDPLAAAFEALPLPVLHGAGREDLDARMLGRGRPFVVELSSPRRRSVDLGAIAAEIDGSARGRVELAVPLRIGSPEAVTRLKTLAPSKLYRALVRADAPLDPRAVASLASLFTGAEVEQRTPERVSHRRADKVRTRKVERLEAKPVDETTLEVEILCASGTYVKELVSGDDGRTRPSVSEALGAGARVIELDVLEVLVEDEAILG